MKRITLLVSFLLLSSAVKAADETLTDDNQKIEDEIMNDMLNQGTAGGTEGDEKVSDDQNEIDFVEDPTVTIDGVPQADEMNQPAEDPAPYDYKSLVNGQMLNPEEIDFVEDPTVTIDGVPQADEMNQPAEDPAPYGWEFFPFKWCTIQGRSLIYKSRVNLIDHLECQRRCISTPGCKAIEHWGKYNNACFVCVNPSLMQPYTNQRDLAYPAHVWVQIRQPPISASPPAPSIPSHSVSQPPISASPPAPSIPSHSDIKVACGQNEMSITIPKRLLPALDRDHIRLSNVSCGATETASDYILRTKLTECRTVIKHSSNFVSYMNKVEEIPLKPGQIITRVREVEIPFSCYYSNTGVVSAVGLRVRSKKIIFSKKGYGKFVLEMKIFPTDRFVNEYTQRDFPVELELRDIVYVEVSVDTDDGRLEILPVDCFATPDPNPNSQGYKYTFIKNGCAVDDTVDLNLPSPDKRKKRYSLEAFSFVGDHPFVYMHCKVKICNASDPNSRCAQGCIPQRAKRSLMVRETKDEEEFLAQGPFMRKDEEELGETEKQIIDVEKSAKFPTLVAAMAVVAVVCVVGVSYVAWDRRKQKSLRDYQRLTVPSDD